MKKFLGINSLIINVEEIEDAFGIVIVNIYRISIFIKVKYIINNFNNAISFA